MDNQILISPAFEGSISKTDLLKPRGKISLLPLGRRTNLFDEAGTFFKVIGENFHFQLSIDESGLYAERNGDMCILTPNMLAKRELYLFIFTWSPNRIRIITQESLQDDQIVIYKDTPPCSVPLSLKRWAKDNNLISSKKYKTETDFRNAVYQSLADLKSNIEDNGLGESFWDYTYDGNRIIEKLPKKEPLIQPMIKGLIATELYILGIDVYRENVTPVGDVDFTVVGAVDNIGVANMCIELKNAHSSNIENGLLKQLPDYMRSQNAQYGAYCVLNYNLENGDNAKRTELVDGLALKQFRSKDALVRSNIRVFIIDLDRNIVAQKRK